MEVKLRVKSEYRRLCQPISPEAYATLEESMISSSDSTAIKIWNAVVVCDFEKYEICLKHHLPCHTERLHAHSSEEAMMRVCRCQVQRPDLTESMRRYLIGKMAILERIIGFHNAALKRVTEKHEGVLRKNESRYYDTLGTIRERLGAKFNLNPMTIGKYEQYAKDIDIIYDIAPDFAAQALTEKIKLSQMRISEISKMQEAEIRIVAENAELFFYDKTHSEAQPSVRSMGLIKNIPKYDPDAEIESLALTIPSWISSMDRVKLAADRFKISFGAKEKLCIELMHLNRKTIELLNHFREEI